MADEPGPAASFRRASVDEAPAILRVIESAFDRWPSVAIDVPPIDHLRWKMAPPGSPSDLHAVVELEGTIVGVQLRWLGQLDIRSHEIPLDFGVDLSVHHSARGQGLGSMLRDREAERLFGQRKVGLDTVTVNQQVADMYESRGPVRRPLALWVRPLTPRAFIGAHRAGGLAHLADATVRRALRVVSAFSPVGGRPPASWTIEAVTRFDTRADELWQTIRGEYELARIRDAAWLNWRYLDPRAGRIVALQAIEGTRLIGYAAFRDNGTSGRVLDLVTAADRPGVGADLLERGVAELREAGCTLVECLLPPGHREAASLSAGGFSERPSTHAAGITRARNTGTPEIVEVFEDHTLPIHLMYGDFDHG